MHMTIKIIMYINNIPDEIKNARFYEPGNLGHEKQTKEWLQKLREQ